jgi:UDP-N-acetylmuramyl pentapeptide synthase
MQERFIFDRREVQENSIFIALTIGIGNDFALEKRANFLILSKNPDFEIPKNRYIVVEDTLKYITLLAKEKFEKMQKNRGKRVMIIGSVGKTTTKDFIIYILQKQGRNFMELKVIRSPLFYLVLSLVCYFLKNLKQIVLLVRYHFFQKYFLLVSCSCFAVFCK